MEKNLLIAGKELPAGTDFASGASFQGRKTMITKETAEDLEITPPNDVKCLSWNRSSALSARTMVLSSLNEFGNIDEAVLFFDETWLASKYGETLNPSESIKVLEELIASYQYLTMELISRITKKNIYAADNSAAEKSKKTVKLIFLYKSNPSECDGITSSSARAASNLSSPLVAAAANAFKAYAENIAASLVNNTEITPVLVSCEPSNDLATKDSALAVWLCEYIDQIDQLKKGLSPKQKVAWVKAGAKSPGGFSFF